MLSLLLMSHELIGDFGTAQLSMLLRVTLGFPIAADDIIVATQSPEGISAANVLPGTIRTIDLLEGQAMLTVFAGEEFYVRLTATAVQQLGLVEDCHVFLIMKARSFHLL